MPKTVLATLTTLLAPAGLCLAPIVASATPTATYLNNFGGSGSGAGQLSLPAGVATDEEGNIWVADTGHKRVQELSAEGAAGRRDPCWSSAS